MPILKVLADKAAVIIAAPAGRYPTIAANLMSVCGFEQRAARLLLPRRPVLMDVTDMNALVVASKGLDFDGTVKPSDQDSETLEIAAQLFPDTKRRLHLFANSAKDGWCSVIGNDNWIELPSVK